MCVSAAFVMALSLAASPCPWQRRRRRRRADGAGESRVARHVDAGDGRPQERSARRSPTRSCSGWRSCRSRRCGAVCKASAISTASSPGSSTTQPTAKLVGRALTMRYLPVRPDLMEAVNTLAKEGDWDFQYNVRAGEDAKAGDVIVVELGGDGESRDVHGRRHRARHEDGRREGRDHRRRPARSAASSCRGRTSRCYYTGSHASAMADQVGVEWNAPIRLGEMTVLPGDVDHRRRLRRAGVSAAAHRRGDHVGRRPRSTRRTSSAR